MWSDKLQAVFIQQPSVSRAKDTCKTAGFDSLIKYLAREWRKISACDKWKADKEYGLL